MTMVQSNMRDPKAISGKTVLAWLLGFFGKHYEGATTISLILLGIPVVQAIFGKADLALLVTRLRRVRPMV